MQHSHEHSESDYQSTLSLLASLQERADDLLAELAAFQEHLRAQGGHHVVEVRRFKGTVETECKTLKKVAASHQCQKRPVFSESFLPEDNEAGEQDEEQDRKLAHLLRSSNLPFYEAVWTIAKGCQAIRALGKRIYFSKKNGSTPKLQHKQKLPGSRAAATHKQVLVDVVAEDGLQWIKVSTVTEKRLLFEMAKEGWEGYDDSDSNSGSEDTTFERQQESNDSPRGTADLELIRLANDLKAAAAQTRVRHRHPRIRCVLPKITEGTIKEVDAVIADLRATGVTVQCCNSSSTALLNEQNPAACLDSNYSHMLPSSWPPLTPTLNIDCTVLLALISDISHLPRSQLPPPPHSTPQTPHPPIQDPDSTTDGTSYQTAILRQIESEESHPLLPTQIYPVLAHRTLICTHPAAQRMREIVETMGTTAERTRAAILLGEDAYKNIPKAEFQRAWIQHSTHTLPTDTSFQLPIHILDLDIDDLISVPCPPRPRRHSSDNDITPQFPRRIASAVVQSIRLSQINRSVFITGWARQMTTVTSNRAVAASIDRAVDSVLDRLEMLHQEKEKGNDVVGDVGRGMDSVDGNSYSVDVDDDIGLEDELRDFSGPLIWVCDTARSLVGKEKSVKKKDR